MIFETNIEVSVDFSNVGACLFGDAEIGVDVVAEALIYCNFYCEHGAGREIQRLRVNAIENRGDPIADMIIASAERWIESEIGQAWMLNRRFDRFDGERAATDGDRRFDDKRDYT